MKYYDTDRTGCLSYENMMYILIPYTDETVLKAIKKNQQRKG